MNEQMKQTQKLFYQDENGNNFELSIARKFEFEEKTFVLASEGCHHHKDGCNCHEHGHESDADLYLFELSGKTLIPVSDEKLQSLEPLLETL